MFFFLVAIVLNAALGFIFKWAQRQHVPVFPMIVTNYFICFLIGCTLFWSDIIDIRPMEDDWWWFALLLGFFFILGFWAAAKTVQYYGLSAAAVMQRISLVITVLFSSFYWNEVLGWQVYLGIFMALISIILVNQNDKQLSLIKYGGWIIVLPMIAFLASGMIDSTFYFVKKQFGQALREGAFVSIIFGIAFIIGLAFNFSSTYLGKGLSQINLYLKWGVLLGGVNFFSIYTLLKALDSGMIAGIFFPIYNLGIIGISAFGSIFIFGEKWRFWNVVGLVLSMASIILITL